MRPGARQPLHGPLPDEPPRGGQRHAAGPPLRQRRQGRPPRRLCARPCSATPTRPSTRATPAGPDDPRSATYEEVLPGFEAGLHLAHGSAGPAGSPGCVRLATTSPDDAGRRPGERTGAARPTQPLGLPHRRAYRLDGPPGAAVVRPPQPASAAPALRRGRRFRHHVRPGRHAAPDRRRRARRHRLHDGLLRNPALAAPDRPGGDARGCMAQYFGMVSEADHQLGRVWAALEARGRVGRTP